MQMVCTMPRNALATVRLGAALLILAVLAACVARPAVDAHLPPFARLPYEPFSREAAVAIALREWRLFDRPVRDDAPGAGSLSDADRKLERLPGLWQRIGEYWWLGLNADAAERGWTGKHDGHGAAFPPDEDGSYAWSAAFISYVMRMAGAGSRFPYSGSHSDYINQGRDASLGRIASPAVRAERPDLYAPQLGDLVCYGRGWANTVRFEDFPADYFPSHCDIVVGVEPGQLSVVGGNVEDAVAMKHVPTTADGELAGPEQVPVDDRYPWFMVVWVLYDR